MAKNKKFERKPSQLTDLSSVLQSLLANGKSPLSDQFLKFKLVKSWKKIVGATAAEASLPVSLKFSRLVIWVKSSTRLQEMRFMEEELKRRINQFLGTEQVQELRFTLERRRATSEDDVPDSPF
jgi:hypothetical protein